MFPVLAHQEIRVIEMRQRQYQADLEREHLLRARMSDERQTGRINELDLGDARSWQHAIRGWAKWVGPRAAPRFSEETSGSSILVGPNSEARSPSIR